MGRADEDIFAGKTALVTGAARRLGAAIVRDLAAVGVRSVIHYNQSRDAAEALAADTGGWAVFGPLTDSGGPESVWAGAVKAAGRIDLLVNNASIFPEHRLNTFDLDDLEANMRLHAWTPLVLGRAIAAQGSPAAIVNLIDSRVTEYDEHHVPYHISKRVLQDLTRMMALEFAPRVRVNAVAPGLVLPPEGKDTDYLESLRHTNPLDAIGAPENVAAAVRFLLGNEFITGQTIYVDGGRHMRGQVYG